MHGHRNLKLACINLYIMFVIVSTFSWNYLNATPRVRNIDIMKTLITSVPSVQLCVVLTYRVPGVFFFWLSSFGERKVGILYRGSTFIPLLCRRA